MPVTDDLLIGAPAIAGYLGIPVRRVRHLVALERLPVKRDGAKLVSRKTWLEAHYAEPDPPTNGRQRAAGG